MKKFEEVLKDNNINPRTFLERKLFQARWERVEANYAEYCDIVVARNAEWEKLRDKLRSNWREDTFPHLCDFEDTTVFSFSTPKEANALINEAKAKARDYSSLRKSYWDLEEKARTNWVKQLVAKADDNCALIVIKGDYTPSASARFDELVQQQRSASLNILYSPIWVAFNPNEEYDTHNWCMTQANSNVRYVSK